MHVEFFIELVHPPGVMEDQRDESKNRTLLGEPEAEVGSANGDSGEHGAKQYRKPIRHEGPDNKAPEI